jgi:NADH-quinone oxidoreductase subunit F
METPLTQHIQPGGIPMTLKEFEKAGGYKGLHKALKEMTPADVIFTVKGSNLMGRGGAGFPTGVKWGLVPKRLPVRE